MKPKAPGFLLRVFAVPLVSVYMLVVYAYLSFRKRIPSARILRLIFAWVRPRYRGALREFESETGHCYRADLPGRLLDDETALSELVLFEDGEALEGAHSAHDEIRRVGQGRFSHWGSRLYFSTSDNSDPRSNGRRYTVREVRQRNARQDSA